MIARSSESNALRRVLLPMFGRPRMVTRAHRWGDVDDDDDFVVDVNTVVVASSSSPHRCALVTILGLPNMGKSTPLNTLLWDDLVIAISCPQTI